MKAALLGVQIGVRSKTFTLRTQRGLKKQCAFVFGAKNNYSFHSPSCAFIEMLRRSSLSFLGLVSCC